MNGYLSEYKNPSFYTYNLDGDATYIIDGGGDMYDGGIIPDPGCYPAPNIQEVLIVVDQVFFLMQTQLKL